MGAVAGLRDVVEASVVHDRRFGAVLLGEFGIAKLLDRVGRAGFHVVREAERVTDFVRDDVCQELADEIVGHGQFLSALVVGRSLREIPIAHELENVVIDDDVRLEDFAGPRIMHVRTHGVLGGRGQPADGRVAGILGIPAGLLALAGGVLRQDRILEAGGFERRLPGLDALVNPRPPLLRHAAADVENDRLDRLGNLGVGILLLQPPAGDVAHVLDLMAVRIAVVLERDAEEPDAVVELAGGHQLLGQGHHAVMQQNGHRALAGIAAWSAAPAARRRRRRRAVAAVAAARQLVGHQHFRLDILRKHFHGFDEGPLRIDARRVQPPLGAEFLDVRGEQIGHVDHGRLVLAPGLDGEGLDDRLERGGLDRVLDAVVAAGADAVLDVAQQNFFVAQLPAHHAVARCRAAVAEAGLRLFDLRDPQQLVAQRVERNLVENLVVEAVDQEEPLLSRGLVGDDLVIRLDLVLLLLVLLVLGFVLRTVTASAAAAASLSIGRRRCKKERGQANKTQ